MDILLDGRPDYPDDALEELDIVLGSVHSGMDQDRDTMTRRVIRAMENPHIDIIAHLTTRLMGTRAPVEMDVDAIFEAAVATGTVLEINASTSRLDLKDTHIRRAREFGVIFSIGSDSHRTRQFQDLRYGIGMARRGWCEPFRVINTLRHEQFLEFISTPKGKRYALIHRYADRS
jgi:DNA polymerase (family 10)